MITTWHHWVFRMIQEVGFFSVDFGSLSSNKGSVCQMSICLRNLMSVTSECKVILQVKDNVFLQQHNE